VEETNYVSARIGETRSLMRAFFKNYGLLLLAVAIECAVFQFLAHERGRPSFLSYNSFVNILNQSAVYGVLAVGMTFVILTGGIDLSVGSLIAFGGVLCAMTVRAGANVGGPIWLWLLLGWLVAILAGAASGAFAGVLVARLEIPPFIATLASMSSLRGLGYIIAGGQPIAPLPEAYTFLGRHWIAGRAPVGVAVMLAIFALAAILANSTRFGRHVRAIGGNEEAARLSAVNVPRVKFAVYTLCGALAALGGLIVSSKLGSGDPKAGFGDELNVIAAVVVGGASLSGGRGTIGGTFIGLMVVSVLSGGLNWIGVESFGQQVILGLVILAAVLLDRVKSR
jgi:ribose/xylose/arabinose/galactoside ABC-type transport system permease subunit